MKFQHMRQNCAKGKLLKNAERNQLMSKIQAGIDFDFLAHNVLKFLFLYIWFVKDIEYETIGRNTK